VSAIGIGGIDPYLETALGYILCELGAAEL
jgi:hypothetical protein